MRVALLLLIACAAAPAAAQSSNQMLEIRPGPEGSLPSFEATVDELYIAADDGIHGRELWHVEDGQPALLIDFNPGPTSAEVPLLPGTGPLFISGDDGTGSRVWRIEGSAAIPIAGTEGLSFGSGFRYTQFQHVNGKLVFAAYRPEYGSEPWLIEGDSALILADMAPGPASSGTMPPKWACTACDATTLDTTRPPAYTAAAVSSQEVSTARRMAWAASIGGDRSGQGDVPCGRVVRAPRLAAALVSCATLS